MNHCRRNWAAVFSKSSTRLFIRISPAKMANNAMTNSSRTLRPNSPSMHLLFPNIISLVGINHYAGSASYDVTHFVEKDSDLLDIRHSSLYYAILRRDLLLNFSLDLV